MQFADGKGIIAYTKSLKSTARRAYKMGKNVTETVEVTSTLRKDQRTPVYNELGIHKPAIL